jgi:uncharacterized Zn finger protein
MNGWQVHTYDTTEHASRQFIAIRDGFLKALESYEAKTRDSKGRIYSREVERKHLESFKRDWCYPVLGDVQYFLYSEVSSLELRVWEQTVAVSQKQWEAVLRVMGSAPLQSGEQRNVPEE